MNPRKIDFVNRLFALSHCYEDLMIFLNEEKLLSDFEKSCFKEEADKAKLLVTIFEKLKKEDRLMLVDYEWTILPIERLKLTLVTQRDTREFSYNA